jgi:predicted dehydrogenase
MMKLGTIGTSKIATDLAKGALSTGLWELKAVYSRDKKRAEQFAEAFGGADLYDDLERMAQSDIDAVYIASPNSLHYSQSKLFLEHGKHVFCEKPLTVMPWEAAGLAALARSKGLVYLEAIVSMHQPWLNEVRDAITSIGNIGVARFDFCQRSAGYDEFMADGKVPTAYDPGFAAGCLMDVGVYCIYPAVEFFGEPKRTVTEASMLKNGADGSVGGLLIYPQMQVIVSASKTGRGICGSEIIGDRGTVLIGRLHHMTDVKVVYHDKTTREICRDPEKPVLMANEITDFYNYIAYPEKYTEEYRHWQDTAVAVGCVMRSMREQIGLPF